MKLEFKNNLTLRTVPSAMTKLQLICSLLTWLLVLGFLGIVFTVFSEKSTDGAFVNLMTAWLVVLAGTVATSFAIDFKTKIINAGSILWLAFLIYMVSSIVGKL
ncbi:MAG: hypothetical protein ACK5LR_03680 [Mangrovibacterium sp.]